MHANSLHGNQEIPEAIDCNPQSVRSWKACGHTGKSDGVILSMKRANKGAQPNTIGQPSAEFVEKRPPAKGNTGQTTVTDTQGLEGASIGGLSRVR